MDRKAYEELAALGRLAQEFKSDRPALDALDRNIANYHDNMFKVGMADEPDGKKLLIAFLAYAGAINLKKSIQDAIEQGEAAEAQLEAAGYTDGQPNEVEPPGAIN